MEVAISEADNSISIAHESIALTLTHATGGLFTVIDQDSDDSHDECPEDAHLPRGPTREQLSYTRPKHTARIGCSVGEEIRAVLSLPGIEGPSVIVRRVHHIAVTKSRCGVALTVGVGAIIETRLQLAILSIVPRLTHTSTDRILYRTPPIKRAVILTVLDRAILRQKRWRTHYTAKAIAYSIALAFSLQRACYLRYIGNVNIVIGVVVAGLTGVHANLVIGGVVIVAEGTGARDVRAVDPIEPDVAEAEARVAEAVT